ncbi:MAG: alpha/beta hydrolase family protein [Actinobacteria bacterium]|nr:alpha/beta hydrolase family protein [Actinomycetota bacterium]
MKFRPRYTMLAVILILSANIAYSNQLQELPEARIVGRVGRSALLQAGKQKILLLQGSPYQIGYAHGRLLPEDVKKTVDTVLLVSQAADSQRRGDFFAGTLEEIYKRVEPYIPSRYREELAGLADGAGLDRKQVVLANIFPEMFHCSGLALMGKATKDGELIHGRILDYMTEVDLQNQAVLMVTKVDGGNACMIAGYTGFIGCVTGMNDKQVAIGEMGMGGYGQWDGIPMAFMLRQILEECDTLEQALNLIKRSSRTCEYAYVISDGKSSSARAVRAQPDLLEFVRPGEIHPLLRTPVQDCVLVSSDERYKLLVERVKENFGNIDLATTVEMMKRPLAMRSNLHNAIMLPKKSVMYLANAVATDQENFQACYQPYYKYDLKKYLAILDDLAGKYDPTEPKRIALADLYVSNEQSQAPDQPSQTIRRGRISAETYRPIKTSQDPHVTELLKAYAVEPQAFDWKMQLKHKDANYTCWDVSFPSPYTSADPENNTVWCEYFKTNKENPKPAVIVLHILEDDFTLPRIVCHFLASNGIDALLLKMPYYGPRRPQDPARQKSLADDPGIRAVQQAVMDVRRAERFLVNQPGVKPDKIGLCGISLGAIVAATTVGVDGNFPKAALILGGGDLAGMLTSDNKETQKIKDYLQKHNMDSQQVRTFLEPIEPLTFAARATNTEVLMLNARQDKIIPEANAQKLADTLPNSKLIWYEADHYKMAWYLFDTLAKVSVFFGK